MSFTLGEVCLKIDAKIRKGNESYQVNSLKDIQNASKDSIVVFIDKKYLNLLKNTIANTCLTSEENVSLCSSFENIIISEDPQLSFALLTNIFYPRKLNFPGEKSKKFNNSPVIGIGSKIATNVMFGSNVSIGCNCTIEENVVIGDDTIIDHNCIVYSSTKVGSNCHISSGVVIGSQGFGFVNYQKEWLQVKHIGDVEIGDNVYIGSNSTIDRGTLSNTVIHDKVIIDNLVHIAHNVSIGTGTAIAAKVGIAGSTKVGKRCMIGGMVGIFGHLNITDDVVITPKSNVYRDIKKPGRYSSLFPLIEHSLWKKISILITKLDKILNSFKK